MVSKNAPESVGTVIVDAKPKNVQVNASIPEDAYQVLSDYRFDLRMNRFQDVIREAVMEKVEKILASKA